MATTTTHLGLILPGDSDFQDAAVLAQNFQKIDDYLKDSDSFVPLPLGNNTTEWNNNWSTTFGYTPSYVDKGDHYLLRGVAARAGTTPPNLVNGETVARLPNSISASQYKTASGSGGSAVNLQATTAGLIIVRAMASGTSSWVSLDDWKIWKV